MTLAPGVEFFEDKHEYWYKGKQLSGVTGLISKKLGLKMPQEFLEEHAEEGIHVHKAIQRWIETGNPQSVHPGVQWLIETFRQNYPQGQLYSEVLVSDFKQYASAVDIILDTGEGLVIFDIKKGNLNRQYVSLQLNIYRYFIETFTKYRVTTMAVICLKDRDYYPIFPKGRVEVEKLLYS